MAVVYTSYSLRMEGEATKESVVCGRVSQQKLAVNECVENGNGKCNFMGSSAVSDVFIVLFTFLAHYYLQK